MGQRISILIPVQLPEWWRSLAVERYAKYASHGTEVVGIDLEDSQQALLTEDSLPGFLLENALKMEAEGIDGHIIDCFSDPGLAKLSHDLTCPVVGVGQAGLWYAFGRFDRFAVITSERQTADRVRENAEAWGMGSRLVGAVEIGIPAEAVPDDRERATEACMRGARALSDQVDALILGCTELAEFAQAIQTRLQSEGARLRVINPIAVAIRLAEIHVLLDRSTANPQPQ